MTMLVRGGAVTGPALPATATPGQVLQWNGSAWVPATPSASGTTPNATPTVPGLVQLAGDLGGTATAPTVAKIGGATPAAVATTGKYSDLTGAPALAPVATTGSYTDLTGRPALAAVATTGAYADLTGRPALAAVATSGSYGDLTGRPLLATVATTGAYADLTGTPTVPTLYLRAKTTATPTTSTTPANDPDLQIALLPVGTYALEGFLANAAGSSANTICAFVTSGTVTISEDVNTGTGSSSGTTSITLASARPDSFTGVAIVTAAGSFGVQTSSSSAGVQGGLGPGTWMRLTKLA